MDLDLPLLSDWNAEAMSAFGVARTYNGLANVAERSAFLVDPDGMIRGAWSYETAEIPDFDELLAAARSLRSA